MNLFTLDLKVMFKEGLMIDILKELYFVMSFFTLKYKSFINLNGSSCTLNNPYPAASVIVYMGWKRTCMCVFDVMSHNMSSDCKEPYELINPWVLLNLQCIKVGWSCKLELGQK